MKLTHRYDSALAFVASAHREHLRKGTDIPYLCHLLHVSAVVMEAGGTEDGCIAALLHDVIEDQAEKFGGAKTLKDYIESEWGADVLKVVIEVTDTEEHPKPPWEKISPSGKLVSVADKLANLRSILQELRSEGTAMWGKFRRGREVTLAHYRKNVDRLIEIYPCPLTDELNFVLTEIERFSAEPPPTPSR